MDLAKVEALSRFWLEAKQMEASWRDTRILMENSILEITGSKPEGSETHSAGEFKVTVTGKMTRTLDADLWESVKDSIPEDLRPVTYKPSLDLKGLRYLQENKPEIYAIAAKAIETKPAKTAIAIKEA